MICTWLIDSDQFESAKVKTAVYFFDLFSIQNVLLGFTKLVKCINTLQKFYKKNSLKSLLLKKVHASLTTV